jgi:hypothetical protein
VGSLAGLGTANQWAQGIAGMKYKSSKQHLIPSVENVISFIPCGIIEKYDVYGDELTQPTHRYSCMIDQCHKEMITSC